MKNILSSFNKNLGDSKRYNAFTLAEVLITLGIIGIIAALTIPTLISKVQKHEYLVALKKFYSTQQDGWSRLLADEGVNELGDTSIFQNMTQDSCSSPESTSDTCRPFFDSLKKYFRLNAVSPVKYKAYLLDGSLYAYETNATIISFADGSALYFIVLYKETKKADAARSAVISAGGGHMYSEQGNMYVDVNGLNKPNMWGRDIFLFEISGDGKLYSRDGKDYSLYHNGDLSAVWQDNPNRCGAAGSQDGGQGWGCSARVIEEGWQMNY